MKKKICEIFDALSDYYKKDNLLKLSPSLSGNIGVIIFLQYYYYFTKDEKALNILNDSIETLIYQANIYINRPIYLINHWNGLSSLIWALNQLNESQILNLKVDLAFDHYNDILTKIMINFIKNNEYDYFKGGLGIASTLRKISLHFDELVAMITIELNLTSVNDENNNTYWVVVDKFSGLLQTNLGLAHGLPSIIKSISDFCVTGNVNSKLLLEKSVSYLLNQKLPPNQYNSIYPNLALESMDKIHSSRLAWCYGDLGISVALWHASQALGRKDWEQEAVDTILHASKRRGLVENGVVDAGLCHGTAGIAHIFNRMYGYTGLEELKEASNYWFAETLKMARFEDGLAGFKAWQGNERGWVNEPGLLEGIAGIGLALISAVSDIEPAWDECLLLS